MNGGEFRKSVDESRLYLYSWLFLRKGDQLESQWPIVTESDDLVQTKMYQILPGDFKLRPHERGASTFPKRFLNVKYVVLIWSEIYMQVKLDIKELVLN